MEDEMRNNPLITAYDGHRPVIHAQAFVDVSARLIGRVHISPGASVWPMAVLRADDDEIRVQDRAAVLDLALLEAPEGLPVIIEEEALVSHGAMIHGAVVRARALVGIGAIVLDGAEIGAGAIIASGSLVTPRTKIPDHALVMGSPGKVIRETRPEERQAARAQITELYDKSRRYMSG